MYTKYKIIPFCPCHFVRTILSNTILSVYHFVHTILSVPFCPIPFCLYTILSIPFCPYHFVRYHFVRSPKKWCDNHAYSGLIQRIICQLSNLSNKLKDTKANQNTRSKNPTTSLQLAIHFSFSPLSLSCLI